MRANSPAAKKASRASRTASARRWITGSMGVARIELA
jgi:hypothetical protein